MGRIVRIPVRAVRPVAESTPTQPLAYRHEVEETQGKVQEAGQELGVDDTPVQDTDWCGRALRLQAEMENYRKRQQRLAQDQIESERQRLLRAFLRVVDDLERALDAPARDENLRQGVQLTHRAAMQLLEREGVERIHPRNQPFDPTWQEAVSTIHHTQVDSAPDTVVQVLEPGYRLGDHLLRPARVVVAI